MEQNLNEELGAIDESIGKDYLKSTKEESEIFEEQNKRSKNKHKHFVFIASLYLLWIIAMFIVLLRVYHFLAPFCWHWLDLEQLQSLDKLMFSGAVGTILGKYGKNLID